MFSTLSLNWALTADAGYQGPNAFDLNLDLMTITKDAGTRRGSGQDNISWKKRKDLRCSGHEFRHRVVHIRGIAFLHYVTINPARDIQRVGIKLRFDPGPQWG